MSMTVLLFLWMLVVLEAGSQVTAQNSSGHFGNDSIKLDVAINNFQLQLYKGLAKTNQNLICSGYGVATTLNMLLAGARTTTEKELMDVLGYNAVGLTKRQAEAAYHDILRNQHSHHHGYELNITNNIFIQSEENVLTQYLSTLRNVFYSRVSIGNFTNSTSTHEANRLISLTSTKLPEIFNSPFDSSTHLMLYSAASFNATWQHEFNKNLTAPRPFHNGNTTKNILFMNTINVFNYSETKDVQVLELPFRGSDLLLVIILPKTVNGLPDFEKSLNLSTIAMFRNDTRLKRVHVQIPKFTAISSLQLSDVLKSLGMNESFTPAADLTGIETRRGLYVSEASQLAVMGVNEDGAVGASISAQRLKRQVRPPPPFRPIQFTADHPFLYSVFHQPTGIVLFLGRMSEA